MFEKLKSLPFKTKNRYLLIGLGVFIVLAYLSTISKTVEAYQKNKELNQILASAANAPQRMGQIKRKLHAYDKNLGSFELDSIINHEYALATVSEFCQEHHLILDEFPDSRIELGEDFDIYTSEVVVEGGFIDQLELVYRLEQKERIARLASVSFDMKKDRVTRKMKLTATMFLQNIKFKTGKE